MANHCIDVICSNCGAVYCIRGCGFSHPADPEYLKEWLKNKPEEKRFVMSSGDCCSGHPQYSWSCGDIKT